MYFVQDLCAENLLDWWTPFTLRKDVIVYAPPKFGGYQWGYLRDLAEESGVTPLPQQFEDLYELVWNR